MKAAARTGHRRIDLLLVERGLFESRAKAQAAIEAGLVSAAGSPVRRASALVDPGTEILAEAPHPYVSRGGMKLAHALDAFGIDPAGWTCLDVGASTGGFADVLLRRGAARVYAVDVGHGQLHPRIAADPRVVAFEGTDIRKLTAEMVPDPIRLATVDVSFISLKLVIPELMQHMSNDGQLVALVKPQFEVGRGGIGRGGIVRDESLRQAAVDAVAAAVVAAGFVVQGTVPSPVAGGDGNREFLLGARRG